MILGIGVDMVEIRRILHYINRSDTFFQETFTEAERSASQCAADKHGYLAARFAAKEAVFKALAHRTEKKSFDFRSVETLNHPDGAPYINISGPLRPILAEAGVHSLHISLTTEGDYALAYVVAEG